MIGEAKSDVIAARDLPAGGERRHLAGEMSSEFGSGGFHRGCPKLVLQGARKASC